MKASDKINLLLKGVSMKDIKDLETQEQEEAAAAEAENQDSNEDEPEEESANNAEAIEQLTEAVAEAVAKKLQLDNLHADRSADNPKARTAEEIAASIFKPRTTAGKKKGDK
jgi:predicted methyltransferase